MMFLETGNGTNREELTAVSVNGFNILMIRNSHEQIFSDSEHYLKSMAPLICGQPGDWRLRT